MTTDYTWLIEQIDCYPQLDGKTDVVFTVHWRCNAADDTFNATQYGSVNVNYNPDEPYTPYADLTQDQVLGWVWSNGVDKDATEAALAQNINDQINPPVVTPPLPWA